MKTENIQTSDGQYENDHFRLFVNKLFRNITCRITIYTRGQRLCLKVISCTVQYLTSLYYFTHRSANSQLCDGSCRRPPCRRPSSSSSSSSFVRCSVSLLEVAHRRTFFFAAATTASFHSSRVKLFRSTPGGQCSHQYKASHHLMPEGHEGPANMKGRFGVWRHCCISRMRGSTHSVVMRHSNW